MSIPAYEFAPGIVVQGFTPPLALKDSIIIGASGGDRGVRDWIASLDAKTVIVR